MWSASPRAKTLSGESWCVLPDAGVPAPPPAAATLFGDRLGLAVRYAELLAGPGVLRGLLGPREVPRLWERHILNSAVLSPLVPASARVVDVGSGAGLPGIPLAIARPDLAVELLEPLARRVSFLNEAVASLALPRVTVVRARSAQRAAQDPGFDVCLARAVAPLDRLVPECLQLLRPGGVLLAVKGGTAAAELAATRAQLRRLAAGRAQIVTVGEGLVDPPTTVVTINRLQRSSTARSVRSSTPVQRP